MTTAMSAALELATRITGLIEAGEFPPGTQLSEVALAEELGVSRNTLREAFRVLARDGLVDHIPNRGVFVHTFTREDVSDLWAYRNFVEVGAVGGAETGTERFRACLARMSAAFADARAGVAARDWQAVGTANNAFHQAIVDLAGVRRLSADAHNALALARIGFLSTNPDSAFHEPYVEMNGRLLELLEAGELEAAAEFLRSYFERSQGDLLAQLPKNREVV